MQEEEAHELDAIEIFLMSIKAAETKERYRQRFNYFCRNVLMTPQQVAELGSKDVAALNNVIIKYIKFLRDRVEKGEIRASSMTENFKPIQLFCEMNDITINWKKLKRLIPDDRTKSRDRAYTTEEIVRLLEAADLRGKAIILILASSGIRVGAIPWLRIAHLQPVRIDYKLVAGKVRVYADTRDEYISFITKECYSTIQAYLEYRVRHKEETQDGKLDPDAPLIRDSMNTVKVQLRSPRAIVARSIQDYLRRLCYKSGIKVKTGKRGELATAHAYRKFFNTTCKDTGMDPLHKELLMGHRTGLEDAYYRPTEEKLLYSYLQVANKLTFDDAQVLREELRKLQEKTEKERMLALTPEAIEEEKKEQNEMKHKVAQLEAFQGFIMKAIEKGQTDLSSPTFSGMLSASMSKWTNLELVEKDEN